MIVLQESVNRRVMMCRDPDLDIILFNRTCHVCNVEVTQHQPQKQTCERFTKLSIIAIAGHQTILHLSASVLYTVYSDSRH
jgi:hypothetical protein